MEAECGILEFDELQPEHIAQTKRLRDFLCGILFAGPCSAEIKLVGENEIKGLKRRIIFQKLDRLVDMHAALHVEHHRVHLCTRGRFRSPGIDDVGLGELRDVAHDALLRFLLQTSRKTGRLFFFQFNH